MHERNEQQHAAHPRVLLLRPSTCAALQRDVTAEGGHGDADIAAVTWIKLSSVTHDFNTGQRFSRLKFAPAAGGLTVTAPSDPRLSPPGHYLLFLLNAQGVPSVSQVVRIG